MKSNNFDTICVFGKEKEAQFRELTTYTIPNPPTSKYNIVFIIRIQFNYSKQYFCHSSVFVIYTIVIISCFILQELSAMCLLFLLAGYETTSTTLAYIMYEMAVNPEVQKKLQEEIDENFPDHVSIVYTMCFIIKKMAKN